MAAQTITPSRTRLFDLMSHREVQRGRKTCPKTQVSRGAGTV